MAQDNSKLLLSGRAAAISVFRARDHVFGLLPPAANYMSRVIEMLSQLEGMDSVGVVFIASRFSEEACSIVPSLANGYGLNTSRMHMLHSPASAIELRSAAESFVDGNPDVVVSCMYDDDCREWNRTMRNATWSPKLQVFTVCIGLDELSTKNDFQFNAGVSPWSGGGPFVDGVTGGLDVLRFHCTLLGVCETVSCNISCSLFCFCGECTSSGD